MKLGDKASEDVRPELVNGVKRRLPRAVTPDGQLAEQVVAAYDNRAAKNRMELIGIDIDAVMATVSQCVVKLACSITFSFFRILAGSCGLLMVVGHWLTPARG